MNTPDFVAIVGLVVTLPPSFVALRALVRRQGVVREDPESCNAPSQTEETLELPEPPNNANSGPVGLADVASNTQNEQSGEPVELSGGCEQLCKEERVPEHEQSLPVDKIEE